MAEADAWKVTADPHRPEDALRFFQEKVPLTPEAYRSLRTEARQRAFTVAHATRLDQVNDVLKGVESAIAHGDSFDKFKRRITDRLGQAWGNKGFALETVFRTNVQASYSAGRLASAMRPDNLAARPIARFNALEDGRLCPVCGACDGVTLPLDDEWWKFHMPVLHQNCRCEMDPLRPDEAKLTKPDEIPRPDVAEGFGTPADLSDWAPDLSTKDPDAAMIYRQKLEDLPPAAIPALEDLPAPPPAPTPAPALPQDVPKGLVEPKFRPLLRYEYQAPPPSGYAEPVDAALAKAEGLFVDQKKEWGQAVDPNTGRVLFSKTSRSVNHVDISTQEVQALRQAGERDEGAVFTHNHPNGTGFSSADIRMASSTKLSEIRAVTRDTFDNAVLVYRMRPGPSGKWPVTEDIDFFYRRARREAIQELRTHARAGTLDRFQSASFVARRTWRDVADKTGMRFDMEQRPREFGLKPLEEPK